ncbi:BTB/POZ domain-containing protein 7-like protein [Dinothrombium tinctorium]|uniref:BTB/POZ domain-containing protein 7-like protein n=1 Tax=Dinothrombium tinctorium TaxID=1965070 RepID=A0A3S3P6A3_9ACAR|nr:BTB/POZ domain-containing protein 7-like protein [Dinothrombium tinctorium]
MGNSGSTPVNATPAGYLNIAQHRAVDENNSWPPSFADDIGGGCGLLIPSPLLQQCGKGIANDGGTKKRRGNLASLVTLRKRFVRKARRSSKSMDHNQVMRDFLGGWSTRDVLALVDEYEGTRLLKELHLQAEVARPSASTIVSDLTELFEFKYAADTYLIYKGVSFPVHKALVCVRCPFFRELLGKVNTFGAQIPVNIDIPGLRPELFNDLLRYLYTGELTTTSPTPATSAILLRLSEQFGVPNALDQDLKHLLDTGVYSDASLVFSPSPSPNSDCSFMNLPPNAVIKKCRACCDQAEYSCHSAILASRSPFFKNVISRHQRRIVESQRLGQSSGGNIVNTANQKIRIVLDESIISRRFARIILHSMYRDSIDLVTLLPGCVCKCYVTTNDNTPTSSTNSLGSSVTILSSNTSTSSSQSSSILPSNYVKEVMDLYEIARFLELDSLIVSCEDMIIDSLSIDNLVPVIKWSEQAHGSPWVKRQALCYLREEFSTVAFSPILHQLESSHLIEAIKSDFLQASELEVLQAVIKWGENRLMKRMEDREPNVVSQTTHSLRRGLRKKELNDAELRDIISDLMPYVRFGHIIPVDSEVITMALKRGLVSTLPPYMLGEDSAFPCARGISSWLRYKCTSGTFVRPRLFNPYVEEAKACLEERLGRPGEMIPNRSARVISHIPDALYMVDAPNVGPSLEYYSSQATFDGLPEIRRQAQIVQLPVVEPRVLVLMKQREQELKTLALSQRALALVSSRDELTKLIQLRVVREFGLPDAAIEVLSNDHSYVPYSTTDTTSDDLTTSYDFSGILPSSGALSNLGSNGAGVSDKDPYSFGIIGMRTENRTTSDCYLSNYSLESEYMGSSHRLSQAVPDIAMATSALAELHLFKRSTESLIRSPHPPPPQRPATSLDIDRISYLQ